VQNGFFFNESSCQKTAYQPRNRDQLEAESIEIIREVVAELDNPVMLSSIKKDSMCMLRVTRKAIHPAPYTLLPIDRTWNFRTMREKSLAKERTSRSTDRPRPGGLDGTEET
jgi:3'-phosphoadenosine 5'-phosphosulfate sulfotransferase (PAPS reductase)/FAD synthetase